MAERPLTIDGSFGEGGGQILRSSISLALVTGRPIVIENIRAGRQKPGLMRQHLAAVRAAAEIGQAEVEGDELGSRRLSFRPTGVYSGEYYFAIGSAGSATLVLQTVLPALLSASDSSQLRIEGGTHNPFAPPFDFLARAYLPLVRRMGSEVDVTLHRPGFFPAGGGLLAAEVRPAASLGRLEILDRGEIVARRVRVLLARLPEHIAQRECRTIAEETGWGPSCFLVENVSESRGPGNVVLIEIESQQLTEVLVAFGRLGVPAEQVAREAIDEARSYLETGAPVGPHLADQLMLPMGIGAYQGTGGGAFRTSPLTLHATTHLELLRQILEIQATAAEESPGAWRVEIG